MGLFSRLRANIRSSRRNAWQEPYRRFAAALAEVRTQILNLEAQFGTIHMALNRHEQSVTECQRLTAEQGRTLIRLEQLVSGPPARSAPSLDRSVGTTMGAPAHRLDVDQFSEQQKRLLGVFFQHRDHPMSYADVAALLGKSPCTVKNQMNQIRQKANLFDCVTGPQSRNFFRLKDDLKVEKLLTSGRAASRPESFAEPDRPGDEYVPIVKPPF